MFYIFLVYLIYWKLCFIIFLCKGSHIKGDYQMYKKISVFVLLIVLLFTTESFTATHVVGGAGFANLSAAVSDVSVNDGDIIYVMPGTYNEPGTSGTSGVVISKELTITSTNANQTDAVFTCSTLENNSMTNEFLISVSASNVTIENISLDGNSNDDTSAIGRGIYANSGVVDNLTIQNVTISDMYMRGISTYNCNNLLIDSCTIQDIILLADGVNTLGIIVSAPASAGQHVTSTISNNTLINCYSGIGGSGEYNIMYIINNNLSQGGPDSYGIFNNLGGEGVIANNTIDGFYLGIEVWKTTPPAVATPFNGEVHVYGNTVRAFKYGLDFVNSADFTPAKITCTNNYVECTDTSLTSSVGAMAYVWTDTTGPIVDMNNNTIVDFDWGVVIDGPDSTGPYTHSVTVGVNSIKARTGAFDETGSNSWTGNYFSDSYSASTLNIDDNPEDLVLDDIYNVNHHNTLMPSNPDTDSKAVLTVDKTALGTLQTQVVDLGKKHITSANSSNKQNIISESDYYLLSGFLLLLLVLPLLIFYRKKKNLFLYYLFVISSAAVIQFGCFGGGTLDDFLSMSYVGDETTTTSTTTTETTTTTTDTTTTTTTTTSTTTTTTTTTGLVNPVLQVDGTLTVSNQSLFEIDDVTILLTEDFVNNDGSGNDILMADITVSSSTITLTPAAAYGSPSTGDIPFTIELDYTNSIEGSYSGTFEISSNNNFTSLRDKTYFTLEVIK